MELFAQISPLLADGSEFDHMGGFGWGMAIFGWLFMTLVIVLVGWAIWTGTHQSGPQDRRSERAKELLDERYARSEIDRDEYLERKADLER